MSENSMLQEIPETPESVFGPPRIDISGALLMVLVALFVGFFASVGVIITAFLSIGKFSLESGVSPMILAMITFFSLLLGSYIYIWSARIIFPSIYSRNKIFYLQTTVYMVILYICVMPIYLIANSLAFDTVGVLIAYLIHILLAIFGLDLLLSLIAQYRYVVLAFYSNLFGLVISGSILFWIYGTFSPSGSALFILMGLSILGFILSTGITFFVRYLYYQYYTTTGNDPLGSIYGSVEEDERARISSAEQQLFERS